MKNCACFLLLIITATVCATEKITHKMASELWEAGKTSEALGAFESLAKQGNLDPTFSLGVIYENGFSVPRKGHMIKAIELFKFAAEHGHAEAQNRMGGFYYSGNWWGNIDQDLKQAMKWYSLAAEQGHVKSQLRLGNLYCWFGKTVEGYAWLTIAIEKGDRGAIGERQRICKKVTPEIISAANTLVKYLTEAHPLIMPNN